MNTYDIPTSDGYTTVQANTKQDAIAMVPNATLKTSVSSDSLKPSATPTITAPKPSTEAVGASANIETQNQANKDNYTQNLQDKADALKAQSPFQDYLSSIVDQKGEVQQTQEAYAKTVDPAEQELIDIRNQIDAEVQSNRRKIQALEKNPGGLFGGALQDEINRVNNESLAKQADLAVIEMAKQRKYDSAKAIADRAVAVKLEQQRNEIEARRIQYEDWKSAMTIADQRAFEAAQADRQRELDRQESFLNDTYNLAIEAAKNGASQGAITKILNSKDRAEAFTAALHYLYTPPTAGAPTVKTINGVDMQWNPATQTWDPINTSAAEQLTQQSLDQLSFLRTTAKNASDLSGASGASGLKRTAGDILVGDTKYRQLEAYTNTLKVNVLSLMTDPTIKKFFGPQMSNADVELMTSAGTTLNPKSNSPTQMKNEIQRLDDLFNRMQTAVQNGQVSTGTKIITAPDGTQIEIIN